MFVDNVNIFVKAGNGGDGAVSFYRDNMTINGGPDGGNGGKGGDIIIVGSNNLNTLVDFRYQKHFRAENGERGGKKRSSGKSGLDLVIKVPRGCIIKEKKSGQIIADIFEIDKPIVILKGGNGGKGNSEFATSIRQSPNFAKKGHITEEYELILELKIIADVGLIGFPNVGKSTLLASISDAHPKIANYHFTTIAPNLGVVKYYDKACVVADIPGLIEGASEGLGLGHEFLRHIERTRLIVHVIDISGIEGRDAYEDFKKINAELKNYSQELSKKTQIIVLNKCDILGDNREPIEQFKQKLPKKFKDIVEISAFTHANVDKLIALIFKKLAEMPEIEPITLEVAELDKNKELEFKITKDKDGYIVEGTLVDAIIRGVNINDYNSFAYFQKKIIEYGIEKALVEQGAKNGDAIFVGGVEFELQQ